MDMENIVMKKRHPSTTGPIDDMTVYYNAVELWSLASRENFDLVSMVRS